MKALLKRVEHLEHKLKNTNKSLATSQAKQGHLKLNRLPPGERPPISMEELMQRRAAILGKIEKNARYGARDKEALEALQTKHFDVADRLKTGAITKEEAHAEHKGIDNDENAIKARYPQRDIRDATAETVARGRGMARGSRGPKPATSAPRIVEVTDIPGNAARYNSFPAPGARGLGSMVPTGLRFGRQF